MMCQVSGCENPSVTAIDLAAGRNLEPAGHRYEAVVCAVHAREIDAGASWAFQQTDVRSGAWVLLVGDQIGE